MAGRGQALLREVPAVPRSFRVTAGIFWARGLPCRPRLVTGGVSARDHGDIPNAYFMRRNWRKVNSASQARPNLTKHRRSSGIPSTISSVRDGEKQGPSHPWPGLFRSRHRRGYLQFTGNDLDPGSQDVMWARARPAIHPFSCGMLGGECWPFPPVLGRRLPELRYAVITRIGLSRARLRASACSDRFFSSFS
jgi:hypothetical protein